jgi:hypothetical protein
MTSAFMLFQPPSCTKLAMMAALVGGAHSQHQALASMMRCSMEVDKMNDARAERIERIVAKGTRAITKVLALNKVVLADGCNECAVYL